MLFESAVLAGLVAAGFFSLYSRFPESVKKFMLKHGLLTSAGIAVLSYGFLGFTLMAHFANGWIVLFTECGLYIHGHKEEFSYLWDAKDAVSEWLTSIQKALREYGASYRANKALAE